MMWPGEAASPFLGSMAVLHDGFELQIFLS